MAREGTVIEVAAAFGKLGVLSFGGPVAHLGYFHREFVERRRWLDDGAFADLVALCQFLPGPASSQAAWAIGHGRAGPAGALAASAAFVLPSATVMIALGCGAAAWTGDAAAGVVKGLMLAAAAVVAHAVWTMWRRLCVDWPRRGIAAAGMGAVLGAGWFGVPAGWAAVVPVGVIAAAGLAGWSMRGAESGAGGMASTDERSGRRWVTWALLAVLGALLVAGPMVARASGERRVAVLDGMIRSGALVFGGGHVVLPLLHGELVTPGLMREEEFLAGYGAAQALPGPLFAFAGFAGAVAWAEGGGGPTWARAFGGLAATVAVFVPGWLIIAAALPAWERLRRNTTARRMLAGASAGVVGLLGAALVSPVLTHSVGGWVDAAVAGVALAGLASGRVPVLAVVAGCAGAGWAMRICG